ncbi:MAG: 4-hydroxy-tetrahydrodipicolinate reductase [Vampirovibrionales bacterium]
MNIEYILIAGASGKMGTPFVATCLDDDALCLVATTSRRLAGTKIHPQADVHAHANVEEAITHATHPPTVGVELTHPSTVYANVLAMIDAGIAPVIGATGLSTEQEKEIDAQLKAKKLAGLLVPNFSIGAVLMMRFAAEASRYFNHAEIIELHHNQKADAPSGTSLRTVQMMQAVRPDFAVGNGIEHETLAGARGATSEGKIHIHSVRLPGLVAHQEVLFGDLGQMLTIRHDSFNRDCFMAGIALCCKKVRSLEHGLHYGLETVM